MIEAILISFTLGVIVGGAVIAHLILKNSDEAAYKRELNRRYRK